MLGTVMRRTCVQHAAFKHWAPAGATFKLNSMLHKQVLRGVTSGAVQGVIQELRSILDAKSVSTSRDTLHQHGRDEGLEAAHPPDVVVYPRSTSEVQLVVAACTRHRVPVIPFGVGSSVEGHVAAIHGGVCVDMSRHMTDVLEINQEDMDCRVQAGCTRLALAAALRHTGLFFPVDPGADASIGGMAATRASGTNAVRYGTMRDAVLGVTAVMADGSVIQTGRRVRKSSAGYDLTRLLVGSEGTLGVITEVALRLHAVPECTSAAVCTFSSLQSAVESAQAVMGCSIPVARVELLDAAAVAAVNRYSKTTLTEAPTIFFEFHGSKTAVEEQSQAVASIVGDYGGSQFSWATEQAERDTLWKARHSAYWAALALRPGCKGFPTDVCVPITSLADNIMSAQADVQAAGLCAPMVGHVGDGNFHMMLVVDPNSKSEVSKAKQVSASIVRRALASGGTCTGEHGVGFGKLGYLDEEWGGHAPLDIMHHIKRALDPHNILNPGKLGSDPRLFKASESAV